MPVRFCVYLRRKEEGRGLGDDLVSSTTYSKSCVHPPLLLAAVYRPKWLMEAAKAKSGDFVADYGYCIGPERGYFCLLDAEFVSIYGPVQYSNADPTAIIQGCGIEFFDSSHLVKPRAVGPSFELLNRIPVHASASTGHYTRIVKNLFTSGMSVIRECSPEVIKISVFGV